MASPPGRVVPADVVYRRVVPACAARALLSLPREGGMKRPS